MGLVQRRVEPVAADQALEAVAQLDESQPGAGGVQLLVQGLEHRRRRDVDVGDRLALEHDPRGGPPTRQLPHLVAELPTVGEEERCLPAVDDDPRQFGRLRVSGGAVPSAQFRHFSEDSAVRPPTALEEEENDQDDRDDDPLEHAEEHDAGSGHQAHDERGRSDLEEAPERSEVGE